MSEPKIPNEVYKKAAELLDKFPGVDFMNIVRLLVIGRESNELQYHSLHLGLDEDPEQTTESTPEHYKRRGRPRRREITFANGKIYAYPNQLDMLRMNGIKDIDVFPHNCPKDGDYVQLESVAVEEIFRLAGKPIIQYACYDFDGKKRVFVFTKESEAVNA